MAKKRYINTVFWSDNYICNLDPSEKLLFLYLITNPHTNISGVYQIPLKTIAADTGIDKEMCQKIIDRFQKDDKILYYDGWIAIKNFIKHQNINSPTVKTAIESELVNIPDTVSIWYQTKLDTHSISISINQSKSKSINKDVHNEISEYFKSINPDYYHNGKHAGAITKLLSRFKTKDEIISLVSKLKTIKKKDASPFWTNCPITPHDIYSRADQIIAWSIRTDNKNKKQSIYPDLEPLI